MRAWLVALLVLGMALAGCGDKEDKGPGGIPYETPPSEGGVYVIVITDKNKIDPVNAKVPAGAIVEWQFEIDGCILKADDGSFDSSKSPATNGQTYNSGGIPEGQSWRWKEAKEGVHEYGCSGKSSISGTIKVT